MAEIDPEDLLPARLLGRIEALEGMVAALLWLLPDNALQRVSDLARDLHREAESILRNNDNDPQRDRSAGMHDTVTTLWNTVDQIRSELDCGAIKPTLQSFPAPPEAPPGGAG